MQVPHQDPGIFWNLEALEHTKEIDEIYVATDSDKIIKTVESFQFSKTKIYHRDPENAQDNSPTEDVMLEFINKNNFDQTDIFLLVQITSPLTEAIDFTNALKLYREKQVDSLLACACQKRFFWYKDGTPLNYDYNNRPRRQDFDGVFWETGAFYINNIALPQSLSTP